MKIGRNDPCPCGSGKKYKKCCLKTGPDPLNYMKEKLQRFHDRIIPEILRHSEKVFDPMAPVAALEEFFCWPEEEEQIDIEYHEPIFFPWFLFKWRIDPNDNEHDLTGPKDQTVVESYLQTRGSKLDPGEREYLEAFGAAPFSFFEVTDVKPGKSISLRDLLLDTTYLVLEKSGSLSIKKGQVVFCSVVQTGGICMLGGLGMIPFKPSSKIGILALRERMLNAAGSITAETLEEYDIELRAIYHDLFMAETTAPALCNTDGEKLSFHTLKYTISSPQRVFDALKNLTSGFATEEELLESAEFDQNGHLLRVEIPWLVPKNDMHAGLENTVNGRLFINGSEMTCEVNSAERAERLRGIIEQKLPVEDAKYEITAIQSAESMMKDAPPSDTRDMDDEELMQQPEIRAQIKEMMRKHWEAWPDMELPALNGRTPRQAVQTELGRKQVSALLEEAEMTARENHQRLESLENIQRVRSPLGLDQ